MSRLYFLYRPIHFMAIFLNYVCKMKNNNITLFCAILTLNSTNKFTVPLEERRGLNLEDDETSRCSLKLTRAWMKCW